MDIEKKKTKKKINDSKVDNNPSKKKKPPKEIGGRGGLDPTRYGDWEKAGRCIDF